jgi:hypothetical protein
VLKAICCCFLLSLSLTLGSCGGVAGLAVGAIGRSAGTGGDYVSWKSAMPGIQRGTGRLLVYATGRSMSLYTISMATGGVREFAVDKDVCGVIEDAFMYVDVPPGDHDISADDMEMLFGKFRRGKFDTRIKVSDGAITYLRIDNVDGHLAPRLVDAATAEAEMAKLPLDTHFVSFECKKDAAQERGT